MPLGQCHTTACDSRSVSHKELRDFTAELTVTRGQVYPNVCIEQPEDGTGLDVSVHRRRNRGRGWGVGGRGGLGPPNLGHYVYKVC